jgi:hypothetical protein
MKEEGQGFYCQCMICDKKIQLWDSYLNRWKGGIVDKITGNYGSNYHGRTFTVAFCDDCITNMYFKKQK